MHLWKFGKNPFGGSCFKNSGIELILTNVLVLVLSKILIIFCRIYFLKKLIHLLQYTRSISCKFLNVNGWEMHSGEMIYYHVINSRYVINSGTSIVLFVSHLPASTVYVTALGGTAVIGITITSRGGWWRSGLVKGRERDSGSSRL